MKAENDTKYICAKNNSQELWWNDKVCDLVDTNSPMRPVIRIGPRIRLNPLRQEFQEKIAVIVASEISENDFRGTYKIKNICKKKGEKVISDEVNEIICRKGKNQWALNEVLDYLIKLLNIELIDERFCYYEEPVWKPIDSELTLSQISYGKFEKHTYLNKSQFRELFHALEGRKFNMKNIKTSEHKNPNYICFRNGVYDIKNDRMLQHSAKYYFFTYLDFNYFPGEIGNGKVFDDYLESLSNGNENVKERVLQIISYCVSDLKNTKKIPLLIGRRDSGKTTLTRIIHSIVGEKNGVAISLENVNRFSAVNLYEKKIGICSDLSGKTISNAAAEELKLLTGGDVVRAERKGKDAFTFLPTCKILIASNFKPRLASVDMALEDRWLIVPFPNSISEEEKNLNLLDEIMQEDVIQHIFYLAFDALRRFINNGYVFESIGELEFYNPSDESNSVVMFYNEKCEFQEGTKIEKATLYGEYKKFCDENFLEACTQYVFGREFKKIMMRNDYKEDRNGFRGYKNLGIR